MMSATETIHRDADGQYAKPIKGKTHDGVESAKPTVVTGSEDATVHKVPPGQKGPDKDWDLNFDVSEINRSDNN